MRRPGSSEELLYNAEAARGRRCGVLREPLNLIQTSHGVMGHRLLRRSRLSQLHREYLELTLVTVFVYQFQAMAHRFVGKFILLIGEGSVPYCRFFAPEIQSSSP